MAIFGPKPWVNPFGKMSIFWLFELLVFLGYKGVFSAYTSLKKKLEEWELLDQNHGLTPLEKYHFFDVMNFLSL